MELLSRIQDNWIVLLIPLISALVGWFTNVVAIKMMFHPVEFVGIPPYGRVRWHPALSRLAGRHPRQRPAPR
jgi:hypothetical protein